MRTLSLKEYKILADILDDTPQAVTAKHFLRRYYCTAYISGNLPNYNAVIIRPKSLPDELMAFGPEPEAIFDILKQLENWRCIELCSSHAAVIDRLFTQNMQIRFKYAFYVYLTQSKPVVMKNSKIHSLKPDDLELLQTSSPEIIEWVKPSYGNLRELLFNGIISCILQNNKIISISHTYTRTNSYSEIGVFTLEEFRGQGLGTAVASSVCQQVHQAGQIPSWRTTFDHPASLRIAEKLGFIETARSTYLIIN